MVSLDLENQISKILNFNQISDLIKYNPTIQTLWDYTEVYVYWIITNVLEKLLIPLLTYLSQHLILSLILLFTMPTIIKIFIDFTTTAYKMMVS